jgi:hypothetical protein
MKEKTKIKVIKKNRPAAVVKQVPPKKEEKATTRRHMVSTISDWVNELRKDKETSNVPHETFVSRSGQKA